VTSRDAPSLHRGVVESAISLFARQVGHHREATPMILR
jgi:hypothetical protein